MKFSWEISLKIVTPALQPMFSCKKNILQNIEDMKFRQASQPPTYIIIDVSQINHNFKRKTHKSQETKLTYHHYYEPYNILHTRQETYIHTTITIIIPQKSINNISQVSILLVIKEKYGAI